MIHYLKNGITESENIKVLSANAIEISENNNKTYIELLDEKRFLIKFKDNMNVTNLINFVVKTWW